MGKKRPTAEKALGTAPESRQPVPCAPCADGAPAPDRQPTPKKPRRKSKRQLVKMAIAKFESAIASEGFKPTVADFVRLLQMEKELEEERVREVTVRWVEPDQKEDTSKT